ncbi:hypothetical protein GE061_016864 [Apolygus lucorum]|uniref:Uncharacterized protein n=1 Tax=Apolygus lucorum TaxID=248454 RepID=A0A8S9XJG7_APOLU|nr:hypothetical protein GE061_016864 [Apolygus lucorum]
MLSFLMGKRKRRGERSRMGNNHSKIEENGGARGRGNETNLTDDEKGSENLSEAIPEISTITELTEVPHDAGNRDFAPPSETFVDISQEHDKTRGVTVENPTAEHCCRGLDEISPTTNSFCCNEEIISGANIEKEETNEKVKDLGRSSVGLNSTESPITCHEREQVLRITRVHSLDSSSEEPRGLNQSNSSVVVVTKCDDGRGAGQSAAKTLTDLEKSRKAFFLGLLEETVEEIYPEDVKYPPETTLEGVQVSTNCAVSDGSTVDCSENNTVGIDNVCTLTDELLIAQPKIMSDLVCDVDGSTNNIVHPIVESINLELDGNRVEGEERSNDLLSLRQFQLSKNNNDSEEDTQKSSKDIYDDVVESTIVADNEIHCLNTEDEEHSDMECDDEESGIVGNSDALSLNDLSSTNTIDERVTDSGLEIPDLDDVLHTELDEISLEEFETAAGCDANESISIDLVITEEKCDCVGVQAPEVVVENSESGPENRAEDPGQSGNDAKLDEDENCVETGEGESVDRPRGGLGTGLPGPRRGLMAPVQCAIPRDEHRVDMLTLSNGTYETFPRSNLSLASSSDESIGTKVKKHVRWADTDEGRSLESYDSYSSCSSSEDEESASEDEKPGVDQELDVTKDVTADVDEDDDEEDEDDTSDSDEESESDEDENKTGPDDTFTESDITVVNLESANESNDDKLEEDEDDEEEEEEEMEDDETETKTEENLVEKITRLQEELLSKAASLERKFL